MAGHHSRTSGLLAVALLLVTQWLGGCAGTSFNESLIKGARDYAKTQGVDIPTWKYSGTVIDRGDEYLVFFMPRTSPQTMGDHYGVTVNKQTGKYAMSDGR